MTTAHHLPPPPNWAPLRAHQDGPSSTLGTAARLGTSAQKTVSRAQPPGASRGSKLGEQYRAGLTGGGKRVADTVGAGSPEFGTDGRKENGGWEKGAKGLRTGGQRSLVDIWRATKAGQSAVADNKSSRGPHSFAHSLEDAQDSLPVLLLSQEPRYEPLESACPLQQRPIFEGLCFFVNGSTAPHVSDHKLKHMLSAHGGRHSITLGRRTVTHVVLGAANTTRGGGGGLAATKMQKEVAGSGGKAIKYVTVEWVLESIKTGRRLPESRFAPLKLAHESQGVVLGTSNHKGATGTAHG